MANEPKGEEKNSQSESKPRASEQGNKTATYTVTMDGGRWSVATFGIVDYLRNHKLARYSTAIVGVIVGLIWIASMGGLKIPGVSSSNLLILAITLVPWLLWLAAVSGPEFALVFPTKDAANERQIAERKFEASKAPTDALDVDLKRLNEYYIINQAQARSSFRWAIFSMLLGFGTIIGGVWLFYLGNDKDTFMASLSTAAGIVVELVTGLFLYLHAKTQERSLHYYDQLARLQRLSIAIRLSEAHQDPQEQKTSRNLLIRELLLSSRHTGESNLTESKTE